MAGIDWESIAKAAGFDGEKTMWQALYIHRSLSVAELARRFGVSHNVIRTRLYEVDVPVRQRGGPNHQKVVITDELVARCKKEGTTSVAEGLGVSYNTLHKALRKFTQAKSGGNPESPGQSDGPTPPASPAATEG